MNGPATSELLSTVERRVLDDDALHGWTGDRTRLRAAVARALAAEGVVVSPLRWAQLVRDLVDRIAGFGPAEALLRDPAVTDVMINGPDEVWVDRAGRLERSDVAFDDEDDLRRAVGRVLAPLGVRLDRAHPWADAVLPDGIRVHALIPPLASQVLVTLRRVPPVVPGWDELVASGTVPPSAVDLLRGAVQQRRNLVVSGRAGVGKTTLLARLMREVADDRVVVIEDAPELGRPCAHAVNLHVRPPTPDGGGGVDVEVLVRNALRMRPDRIVVGEVRGREVADVLQAMNTGHAGSMTSVHANTATDALVRLEGMALLAGLPAAAVRAQVRTAVDLVIHLERGSDGGRRLAAVVDVGRDGVHERWTAS